MLGQVGVDVVGHSEGEGMNIDVYGLLALEVQEMQEQLVAVLGIRGSGKSNTAAVLMEELLALGVPVQAIDIAGEYFTLKERFERVAVIGRGLYTKVDVEVNHENARQIAETTYLNGVPTVFDLSAIPSESRPDMLFNYFKRIWELAAVSRIPTFIFVEEAHNWIPQSRKTAVTDLFVDIAAEGRKRGLSAVLVGQRPARIDKDVLSQAEINFLHHVRISNDMTAYRDLIGLDIKRVRMMVKRLKQGQALVVRGEKTIQYQIRKRHTRHVGKTPSLSNIPEPTQLSLMDLLEL